jgi:hypothetical protein
MPVMNNQAAQFRYHILNEIRRLAVQSGKAPGQAVFARETHISEDQWKGKLWNRWGDALTEAGYGPTASSQKPGADEVLLRVVEACRSYRKVPTYAEMALYRATNPALPGSQVIAAHFTDRSGLLLALSKLAGSDEQYADIKAMLPPDIPIADETVFRGHKNTDGLVYLIRSGEHHKIGQTEKIERGFKEISISLPGKATIIHTIRTDDPPGIEAYWHNRFKDKRANGEWFKLSASDISAFQKRKYQ